MAIRVPHLPLADLLRIAGLIGVALLVAVLFAPDASAHGGRLKPPPEDDLPPDDKPPWGDGPPPPPDMGPEKPRDVPDQKPDKPATTPSPHPFAPSGPPATTPSGGTRPRPGATAVAAWETQWQTWWTLNRWAYLPDRHALRERRDVEVTETVGDAGPEGDRRETWESVQKVAVKSQIVPALLEVLDTKTKLHDEIRSAALLALAKVAQDEAALEIALQYAEDAGSSTLVRESAALAVGLLRRSAPDAQLDAEILDGARERLLALVANEKVPTRTRAFAANSVGLLADQPYGTAFTKDGRVTTRTIWILLEQKHARPDVPIALLTALGMQPAAGVPGGVRDGLKDIALGKRALGRTWDDLERAHAVAAMSRIGGRTCESTLLRVATWVRAPRAVQRAGCLALGARAEAMDPDSRMRAMDAALKAVDLARDPLSRGLAGLAVGRIAGADLRTGSPRMVLKGEVSRVLFKQARSGSPDERGFGALAIGLAVYHVPPEAKETASFLNRVRKFLIETYEKRRGGADVQGAVALALGLAEANKATSLLAASVADRNAAPGLRGNAALALGLFGRRRPEVLQPLKTALWDRRSEELPGQAALALSMLSHDDESALLVKELDGARTERKSAQLALAVGQLGDLSAVPALIDVGKDKDRSAISRAMALASLGLLADPEPRPSLTRLSIDASYPALTDALHEVLTIL